jgi:outer membrane protein TolC
VRIRAILTGLIITSLPAQIALAQPLSITANQSVASSLTLPDVQETALKKNRDVQRARIEVSRTEAVLKSIKASRLPSVLVIGFAGQQVDSPFGQNLALLPGVFGPVTQQYRLSMQVHQANLDVETAKQALRLAKQVAVSDVKKAYLRMVALQSAILSRQDNLASLLVLEKYVEAEVNRGASLKVDLLMVQAKRASAEYELDRDKDEYITAGQTLNRLLDRPINTVFSVSDDPFPVPKEMTRESAVSTALTNRPELFQLKFAAYRAHLEQKVQLSHYIPDISFGGTGLFTHDATPPLIPHFFTFGFLGIWQPWDWGRRVDLGKAAERQRQQSLVALDDLSDKVSVEVDNARRSLKVVEKEVVASALERVSTQENLRITQKRYKVGAAVIKDVTEAQADYTAAISADVQAKSDYVNAQVDFDRALGTDFN